MTTDHRRRSAFSHTFGMYPIMLMQVATEIEKYDKLTPEIPVFTCHGDHKEFALILMAQFFTRILRTRAQEANVLSMEIFGQEVADSYSRFRAALLGPYEIRMPANRQAALNAYEQSMAEVVFEALAEEARIIHMAAANGNMEPDRQWEEADFWLDFFLCFAIHSNARTPRWNLAAQEIFSNNREAFVAACKEVPT